MVRTHDVCAPATPSAVAGHDLTPLPVGAVALDPARELGAWQTVNRERTLPHVVERLGSTGVLDNLRRLVGESDAPFRGPLFADSDLHKTLEAIAWEAARVPADQPWEPFARAAAVLLARVQREDGYLDSHVQGDAARAPWADMRWGHELYVLGHLVQAAVARERATGRDDLMAVARRFADLAVAEFGPSSTRADGLCGHPEVETALVELYRHTGERAYLDTAAAMLDRRGAGALGAGPFEPSYFQDHLPVRESHEATGHAVRQLYLAAGMADVAAETGDGTLEAALERLWASAHGTKAYVTGGMGSRHRDESFGDPYELPPDRAYAETCAAIAAFQWDWRMLLASGDARHADAMERVLLNGIAAGVSTDGRRFFYSNPLQLRSGHDGASEDTPSERLDWYGCACCPPNLARLVSSLGAYVATGTEQRARLYLYAAGTVRLGATTLDVRTDYPWDGRVEIDVTGPLEELALRVPGWCEDAALEVDGVAADAAPDPDGYVRAALAPGGHRIVLTLPMPVDVLAPHPRVDAVRGCVALRRGPVVFCLEQPDLPAGVPLEDVRIDLTVAPRVGPGVRSLRAGATVLAEGVVRSSEGLPRATALRRSSRPSAPSGMLPGRIALRAIPYARWANRAGGAMRVWIPVDEEGLTT
ncbi:glycoside hydrolase family 127 protein [Demequina sp. SYSU T00192]|uniref:Glycoside hydrolase family 127 protein n=1 Tax=Demequina litoralis TaxID=3051660 RepID=A0ABT8G7Z0_9MICO|nr:beta-L-arabinofuranosidase domain-containing protein [Demequina sp. SYSU T00192]MDN4475271.1 glycoside hydrolase family 127 protein [Demequina sp. SYSU T00192]